MPKRIDARGRTRSKDLPGAVIRATTEILETEGLGAVTIRAVAAHAGIPCVLADERETLFYLHAGESLTVTCDTPPRAISLLPFTEECTGVTTRGLYWELQDACITNCASLAISNVLARENTKNTFTVSIKSGVLGVYLCHKE